MHKHHLSTSVSVAMHDPEIQCGILTHGCIACMASWCFMSQCQYYMTQNYVHAEE